MLNSLCQTYDSYLEIPSFKLWSAKFDFLSPGHGVRSITSLRSLLLLDILYIVQDFLLLRRTA
jgi:hypothetical protein